MGSEMCIRDRWRRGKDYMSYSSSTRTWFVCHKNENVSVDDGDDEDFNDDWEDIPGSEPSDWNNEYSESGESSDTSKLFSKYGIMPKFRRMYEVSVHDTNCLTCSCKKHEQMGYPCRHVASVIAPCPDSMGMGFLYTL